MKLLLDECIDRRLADNLPGHAVETVPQRGWAGRSNGELLKLAQRHFDAFLTVDRNLSSQHEVPVLDIAVMVLHATTNRLADLQPVVPAVLAALPTAKPGQVINTRS